MLSTLQKQFDEIEEYISALEEKIYIARQKQIRIQTKIDTLEENTNESS